jgi:mRNA-degrading endonuclease RelE of RelBE toxin-antitoxin system
LPLGRKQGLAAACGKNVHNRRVSEIEAFPEGSASARDERLHAEGYRVSHVRGFVVLYQVDDVSGRVLLTRFVYGRRNYARLL